MDTERAPTQSSPSPGVDTRQAAADKAATPSAVLPPPGAAPALALSEDAERVRAFLASEGRVRGITRIARAAKLSREDAERVADELAAAGIIEHRKGKGRRYAIAGAPGVGTPATQTASSATPPPRQREGEPVRTDAPPTPREPEQASSGASVAAPITPQGLRVSSLVGALCAHTLPPALTPDERVMLDEAFPGLQLPPWAQQAGVLLVVLGPRLQTKLAAQAEAKRKAQAKTPQQANPAPRQPEPKPAPKPEPVPEPVPEPEPETAMQPEEFEGFEAVRADA
jgi:hypothetical protein